jgi:excisionase family DNA binding protein
MSTQPSLFTPRERPHSVREAPVSQQYAARFLNMHPKTVLRKAREGALPAHPVGTDRKRWHFYLSELDDWLRSQVIKGKCSRQYFAPSASDAASATD